MTAIPGMVERVARAICSLWDEDPDELTSPRALVPGIPWWRVYGPDARAALEAHEAALEAAGLVIVPREPTKAMLAVVGPCTTHGCSCADGMGYRAIIAAALEVEPAKDGGMVAKPIVAAPGGGREA